LVKLLVRDFIHVNDHDFIGPNLPPPDMQKIIAGIAQETAKLIGVQNQTEADGEQGASARSKPGLPGITRQAHQRLISRCRNECDANVQVMAVLVMETVRTDPALAH
jgi:hypothetical protein